MAKIELYSGFLCGYCFAAKRLLKRKGVEFEEIKVGFRTALRAVMMKRANRRHTVPQIFIDGIHIGGCDELQALDAAGKLDAVLASGT
jgi:glutaredoxin 3